MKKKNTNRNNRLTSQTLSIKTRGKKLNRIFLKKLQGCSDTEPAECAAALEDDIKFIGEVIGRKQVTSFSILNAVVEVKLETAFVAESKQGNFLNRISIFH